MFLPLVNLLVIIPILFLSFILTWNQPTYEVLNKAEKIESKSIYLTGYSAGWKERREKLVKLVEDTELNSIVIDIKDASGRIFFDTNIPLADEIGSEQIRIPDLKDWLKELKEKDIYTIARIVVFQRNI